MPKRFGTSLLEKWGLTVKDHSMGEERFDKKYKVAAYGFDTAQLQTLLTEDVRQKMLTLGQSKSIVEPGYVRLVYEQNTLTCTLYENLSNVEQVKEVIELTFLIYNRVYDIFTVNGEHKGDECE